MTHAVHDLKRRQCQCGRIKLIRIDLDRVAIGFDDGTSQREDEALAYFHSGLVGSPPAVDRFDFDLTGRGHLWWRLRGQQRTDERGTPED